MPTCALPIAGAKPPHVDGDAEQLAFLLAPMGDPRIVMRIGEEAWVATGSIAVTQGERFRTARGWIQGGRYLMRGKGDDFIGALNVTCQSDGKGRLSALVSNLYVAPDHRREGVASRLIAAALIDHPNLKADNTFSRLGAALFGLTAIDIPLPQAKIAPPHPPHPRHPRHPGLHDSKK